MQVGEAEHQQAPQRAQPRSRGQRRIQLCCSRRLGRRHAWHRRWLPLLLLSLLRLGSCLWRWRLGALELAQRLQVEQLARLQQRGRAEGAARFGYAVAHFDACLLRVAAGLLLLLLILLLCRRRYVALGSRTAAAGTWVGRAAHIARCCWGAAMPPSQAAPAAAARPTAHRRTQELSCEPGERRRRQC